MSADFGNALGSIDAANGALLQVRGAMPEKLRLLAFHQGALVGTIRLIPA